MNAEVRRTVGEERLAEVAAEYSRLRPAAKDDWEAIMAVSQVFDIKPNTVVHYLQRHGTLPVSHRRHSRPSQPASAAAQEITGRLAGDLSAIEEILRLFRRLSPEAQGMVRRGLR